MLCIFLVTVPPRKAGPLARALLEERLIACASLLPGVRSLYWWKGKLARTGETLLLLKTPKRNASRLLKRVRELHPYEVPEILVLPVAQAYQPYADWVLREARRRRS